MATLLYISLYNLLDFLTSNLAFTEILALNDKSQESDELGMRKLYKSRETDQAAIQRYTTAKSTRFILPRSKTLYTENVCYTQLYTRRSNN